MYEVEKFINDRPLVRQLSDPNDLKCLLLMFYFSFDLIIVPSSTAMHLVPPLEPGGISSAFGQRILGSMG